MKLKPREIERLGEVCFGCGKCYNYRSITGARCENCQHSAASATEEMLVNEFNALDDEKKELVVKTLNSRSIDETEMSDRLHDFINECDMEDLIAMFKQTFACVEDVEEDDDGEPIVVFDRELGEKW